MPVVAIPCTKYFCREKNRIKGGSIDSVDIASAPPQFDTEPASPTNVRSALDTLYVSGRVRYSRWLKKSSHVHRKVNSAVVTSAGVARGKIMRKNTPNFPHPSIIAASSSSFGRLRMNCTSRNTKNASVARNFGTSIGRYVPTHPKVLNMI